MLARSYFGVGFLRGLNSVAEVFAPYAGAYEGCLESYGSSPDVISAHRRDALPPAEELEKIDRMIPGGADRLLRMAEKKLDNEFRMSEQELARRFGEMKRGQYLGWSLAIGAVIAAVVMGLCHAPWQLSATLVGIPMMGAVQTLIQGRKEKAEEKQSAGSAPEGQAD